MGWRINVAVLFEVLGIGLLIYNANTLPAWPIRLAFGFIISALALVVWHIARDRSRSCSS